MIVLHLFQRRLAEHLEAPAGQHVGALHRAAHAGQVPRHIPHAVFRNRHADVDHRLHDDGRGALHRVLERPLAGLDKGDLLGVHRVMLAVVDDDPHVLQRVAGDRSLAQHLAHPFLHGRYELRRNHAAHHLVDELETAAPGQGLDTQEHLAELARAAGLLLVPVMTLRLGGDGFPVGDGRQRRGHLDAVLLLYLVECIAQMQFADAEQYRLVHRRYVIEAQRRVFRAKYRKGLVRLLCLGIGFRADRPAVHRLRQRRGLETGVVLVVGVMQNRVEEHLFCPRNGADIPAGRRLDFRVDRAVQLEQMADLQRLARIADEDLPAAPERSLVNPERRHAAAEGVDVHLDHMRHRMGIRIGRELHGLRTGAGHECRRVALGGGRHQPGYHVEEFRNAGAGGGGHETDRHQVAVAQRQLEGIVQPFRGDLALFQISLHQVVVHFDHLVDDLLVRVFHRAEIGLPAVAMKENVDHPRPVTGGQVYRQAFRAERALNLFEYRSDINVFRIDPVDHHHAAQVALGGCIHGSLRHGLDAGRGVHDDGGGFHGRKDRKGPADEVGMTRRIEQVDVHAVVVEMTEPGLQRVPYFLFPGVGVGHRGSGVNGALVWNLSGAVQQGIREFGLAGAAVSHQGDVTDLFGAVCHVLGASQP